MYCTNCGATLAQEVSYCNRCGKNLREKSDNKAAMVTAFVTAMTTVGMAGLGIMLFGMLILRRKANLDQNLIGFFMLFSFLIIGMVEVMLFRSLSKLTSSTDTKKQVSFPQNTQQDLRLPPGMPLGEPVSSVTENTTRTLEYARREQ